MRWRPMLGYWNETPAQWRFTCQKVLNLILCFFPVTSMARRKRSMCHTVSLNHLYTFFFSFPSQSGVLRICQLGWLNTQLDYQNQGIFHHFFIVFPFLKIITGYQTTIPRRFLFMHPSHETFYPFRFMMVPCYYMILFLFPCMLCSFQ